MKFLRTWKTCISYCVSTCTSTCTFFTLQILYDKVYRPHYILITNEISLYLLLEILGNMCFVIIVNLEHISHLVPVFLLLTLNTYCRPGSFIVVPLWEPEAYLNLCWYLRWRFFAKILNGSFKKNKACHIFRKTNISYPLILTGGKKCSFFGKFGVLCFLETPVLRFALLP